MRILLDARPTVGGVHRSTMELVRALEDVLPEGCLVAFGRRGRGSAPPPEPGAARRLIRSLAGGLKRVVTDQVALPRAARRSSADLLHSPSFFLPLALPVPAVVTVYDLTPFRQSVVKKRGPMTWYERRGARRGLNRADRIIVPSDAVARQLERELGVAPERITRIYPFLPALDSAGAATEGARDTDRHDSDPSEAVDVLAGSEGSHPYLLFVGTLEPRKNLGRLLAAHRVVWEHRRVPLLLAGAYGWRQRTLLREIRSAGGRVCWLGRVDDPTLAVLYRDAAALVQPSLEEGFGYPVAEALSLGVPVVASDLPAHREVARDCALYAPAERSDLLAQRLLEVLAWPVERRDAHAEHARARVAALRAATSVEQVLRVYRAAAGGPA